MTLRPQIILDVTRRARSLLGWLCYFLLFSTLALAKQDEVFILAENIQHKNGLTIASGNVAVEINGIRLDCQQLVYDVNKKTITASRGCVFAWGDDFATAESLTFNIDTNSAMLRNVTGKSGQLVADGKEFDGGLYFWAESMSYSKEKVSLQQAVLTTCDIEPNSLHYQIDSSQVDLYPDHKMIASNAAFKIAGHKLYTLPTLVLPRKQAYFPSPGYNKLDGAFLKNSFSYLFSPKSYGALNLDLYQRSGIGYGLEHTLDLGDRGNASLYFYNQKGRQSSRERMELRTNGNFRLSPDTNIDFSYYQNQYELPGQVGPFNISGSVGLAHNTQNSALRLGAIFGRSGNNTNRNYSFSYDRDLSEEWSLTTRADLLTSATAFMESNRFHYLGSLRHRNELFEGDLSYESSHGTSVYFLNRQPELSLRSNPFRIGFLPLVVSTSLGSLQESPSMFRTERYNFDLKIPEQTIATPLGNFHAGAGVRQNIYGSGQEQYMLGARLGWTEDIADHFLWRVDYNLQNSKGFTPFQHDVAFDYQVLSGGVEFYSGDSFRLSTTGAYDLDYSTAFNLVTRLDLHPFDGWGLTAAASLDPNTGTWRTVDSGLTAKLTKELSLTHWSVYDLVNGRLTYQNYAVNFENHDWIGSIAYRGVQNEIFVQFSLKAFPSRPLKVGPDSSLPILPANISNAFTR